MRFFFYGTLLDADVRRVVLGPHAPRTVEPVSLSGWRRVPVRGRTYPVIVSDPGASTAGVLVRGLNAAARHRLERYEDETLYELVEVEVVPNGRARPIRAFVFAGKAPRLMRTTGRWEFDTWSRRHKRRYLLTLTRRSAA